MEGIVNTIKNTYNTLTNTPPKEENNASPIGKKPDEIVEESDQTPKPRTVRRRKTRKPRSKQIVVTYSEALDKYTSMKLNYERKRIKQLIKDRVEGRKITPQCISCRRNVGTLFDYKGGIYSASCGASSDKQPCSLDVRIKRAKVSNLYDRYISLLREMDVIKEDIIRLKLDFMFQFMTEVEMVNSFDILRNKLKNTKTEIQRIQEERNERIANDSDIQMAKRTVEQTLSTINMYIKEYRNSEKEQERYGIVKDLVNEYLENMLPKLRSLRKLQNNHNGIEMIFPRNNEKHIKLVKRSDMYKDDTSGEILSIDERVDTDGEVLSYIV